jgi:hypothetical protein
MPRWAAYIFWIWLFVSLVILVMRRMNARRASEGSSPQAERPPGASTTDPSVSPAPLVGQSTSPPAEKVWPAPPPPDPDDDTYRMDPSEASATTVGPGTAADRSTSPGSSSPGIPTPGAPRSSLPELLAGITLPHELVPLTQSDVSIDLATHIVVYTNKASAEVVTASMCQELEALGYDIERESMLKVRAASERGALLVEVHPDGAAVLDGSVRRFPTAMEGSVVVELWAV